MVDIRRTRQPIAVSYELPWRDNQNNVSCIPEGTYRFTVEKHPAKGMVLRIHDVPFREGVLAHIGNGESNSEGCILTGEMFERFQDKPGVQKSIKGMADVLLYMDGETEGILHIRKAHYDV